MMAATHATHVVRPAATSLGGRRPAARGAVARRTPSTRQVRSPADAAARRAREPHPRPWTRGAMAARPTTFPGRRTRTRSRIFRFLGTERSHAHRATSRVPSHDDDGRARSSRAIGRSLWRSFFFFFASAKRRIAFFFFQKAFFPVPRVKRARSSLTTAYDAYTISYDLFLTSLYSRRRVPLVSEPPLRTAPRPRRRVPPSRVARPAGRLTRRMRRR